MRKLLSRMMAHAGEVIRSRSSALVPLQWKIVVFVVAVLILVVVKAPMWIDISFVSLLALVTLQSMFSYNYFMKDDPTNLRSEKHAITRYAIDKGLYGDSDAGFRELPRVGEDLLLDPSMTRDSISADSQVTEPEGQE